MTSAVSDWEIGRRAGELPEGWAETTLDEIVVHKLGGEWGEDPRKAAERPDLVRVRVIRGTDFRHWERHRGTTAEERLIKPVSLARRQLAVGDLVVEVSGGGASQPVGRTLLIDEEAIRRAGGVPLICSNFCRQVRVHREIDPAFVHLALSYHYLCGRFDEHQTQTTNLRNLDFKGFLSIVLPLPPSAEQRRIVDKVAELMAPLRRVREGLVRVPEMLRRFRQADQATPVLFLTARDAVPDRVRGLDAGADDYLCKPFAFEELLARVRALARRQDRASGTVLSFGDVRVDLATHRAERAGHCLELTAREHALLVFFLRRAGEVLTRTRIYEHVWDERYDGHSNTLEVHVMELRRKLEARGPRLIHTLRGRGYVFGDAPGQPGGEGP